MYLRKLFFLSLLIMFFASPAAGSDYASKAELEKMKKEMAELKALVGELKNVINTQMVIDSKVSQKKGSSTVITISRPVLQRLIDGETLGLAIKPLGAVHASFESMENSNGKFAPVLHFDLE